MFSVRWNIVNLWKFKFKTELSVELEKPSLPEIPIKISITKDSLSLIGQATGQPSFTLETIGKDSFEFSPAGVEIQFIPEKNLLILKQGGGEFTFTRE